MSILFVTGTGTDVGKTVATAALAACAPGRVAVVKLAQTGVGPDEPGDLAEVTRLTGITDVFEFARYPEPASPHVASFLIGAPDYDIGTAVLRLVDLQNTYDTVIVEGAGGVLVPFDEDRNTIVDIAMEVTDDPQFVVVAMSGLGTINHTGLTMYYIEEQTGGTIPKIIIGSWPQKPSIVERCNVFDLARMARRRELAGVLPAGLPAMGDFAERARAFLAPEFGGTFDYPAFRESVRPRSSE